MCEEIKKTVVDQVSIWLKIFNDGSVDRTWMGPPELEFMMKTVPPHEEFIDGVATRDLTIDPISGLSARIYIPERIPGDDESKLPVLLHFHGGGFCISRPQWYMYYHIYSRLVRTARVICVSVDQRLAPEHRLPAACDDCFSTLLWLQDVARAESTEPWLQTYADFTRVFLIGDSSGGNLVHEVAARAGAKDLNPIKLAGGVLLHPGFVRSERSKSELVKQNESPLLTLDMVDKFLALSLPIGSTKDHPITCPMGSMAPFISGLNLPPMLVAIAENDLIRDTELEYCEELKKAGNELEIITNNGVGHSFYLQKTTFEMDPVTTTQTDILVDGIVDFIKRH